MTAQEVKDALRRRHPATQLINGKQVPGGWTTIEEWMGIDLLAFSAHATPQSGGVRGVRYPRVGYEVKVSRGDLRRELLAPRKRALASKFCNAFYFAVPKGLLTDDEVAFQEPDHFDHWGNFVRTPCPGRCRYDGDTKARIRWSRSKGRYVNCHHCDGKGYASTSRVETEAPTLWVPRDVGLIEINGSVARVRKQAPVRKKVTSIDPGKEFNQLVRWISARPDPRHRSLR